MSINNVTLIGNLGGDPEIKYFESGAAVATFSIALNNLPKNGVEQPPDWIEIKAWDKQAQVAADYLRKGSKVGIVGRLKQEKWVDRQTGENRYKINVVASRLELLTPKGDGFGGPAQQAGTAPLARPAWNTAPAGGSSYDDSDIPF